MVQLLFHLHRPRLTEGKAAKAGSFPKLVAGNNQYWGISSTVKCQSTG